VSPKHETDVLVVGAGPVGQITALRLASRGVKVTILDKHWRVGAHSYALALHSDSLALLDELGVLPEVLAEGHRIDKIGFYEGDSRRCELDLAQLDAKYPFVLVVPQSLLETALEKRLLETKVKVLWNHRLEELIESDLTAEIAKLDRVASGYPIAQMEWVVVKTFSARSSFVVGADGYHSIIRERLGIKLKSVAPPLVFSVFEVETGHDLGNEVRVILDEDATSVLWPMENNRCRWSFQIRDPKTHEPTRDYLNTHIKQRAPWAEEIGGTIHWSSAVIFAKRLAESFGRGKIWLAGDSAHLTSPVGVHSMNAGLAEGSDLASRLSEILGGKASEDSLDEYAGTHLGRWRFLLGIDGHLEPANGTDDWVVSRASRIMSSTPATGDDLLQLLGQVGLRYKPAS
jgi:2-polyprenyl-6-methoxyphenol hydroxylase-like FAD-dependent oxidoreductase